MIMYACAILDKKVGAYMKPEFFRTKGEAIRAFADACHNPEGNLKRHSEDYVFCCLGTYDDNAGNFQCPQVPEILSTAVEALAIDG